MICDECKKNEATIHLTNILNGKKTERHLCGDCAGKHNIQNFGVTEFPGFMNMGGSMFDNDFFTNDFFTNAIYPEGVLQRRHEQHCPQCGMTFDEFNRNGRFGCDECYSAFASEIAPLVKRLQGSLNYEGRVPGRGNGVFRTKHQIKRLRQDLQKAVAEEQFEEAARLRDEIKTLEQQLGTQQ